METREPGGRAADSTLPPDEVLVARLRKGDEAAFVLLLDSWSRSMMRVARSFVSTRASAEEVVQDTWVAVIRGIDRFESRSSLRTWVYRILVNTAKTRGMRENRSVPVTSLLPVDSGDGPTVDPARFQGSDGEFPGHWREFPAEWPSPESAALHDEFRRIVSEALDELPERQRIVITLRDVEGYTSEEVCDLLGISAANQRVMLHRARAAVRARLERYFAAVSGDEGQG